MKISFNIIKNARGGGNIKNIDKIEKGEYKEMSKTKAKYLIAILLFLVALIFSNTNTVNATTQEEVQKALDLIPNEIYLDIPEIEYEKANNLLKEKVEQIWRENEIKIAELGNVNCRAYYLYDIDRFYEGNIYIGNNSKTIKITYNNTNNKNENDKKYVQNLKIERPKYYELDTDKDLNVLNNIQRYYDTINKDSSIYLKYVISSGEVDPNNLNTFVGTGNHILIFKDSILYEIRYIETEFTVIPVIEVADDILLDDLNNYIINRAQKFYGDCGYNADFINIEKGCNFNSQYSDISNIYTLTRNDGLKVVVIANVNTKDINLKDEVTNIKIDTTTAVLPANTKLVVKELKEGETYKVAEKLLTNVVDKMYVYDITLQSEGVEVQPNGKVKVSIPIPNDLEANRLVVYGINDDETKTEYAVTVENGFATFQTDHFSIYVLGEKAEEQQITETTQKNEKDNTPKTGNENVVENAIAILIATIGIIAVIRRTMVGGKI